MVQIIPEYHKPSTAERFGQAFSGLGQTLAHDIPEHLLGQKQKRENEGAIQRLIGKDVSGLSPDLQKTYLEKFGRFPEHDKVVNALVHQGVDPDDAELYAYLTTGGQTAFVKDLLEKKKREQTGKGFPKTQGLESFGEEQVAEKKPDQQIKKQLQNYLEEQDQGLTPAEKVNRGKERFATGLKDYQEAGTKLRGMTRDKERLDILSDLNKGNKLPKNLERLNVDKDGNLRLPFAASEEAQRYVKTLNEFSSSAKDTFGSRVTNFDLAQYLKRFPTLLNSNEGRKQLLEQMKIVNQINSVYYKNLKNIYDEAGGVRNIDADVAERFAEQLSESKINELSEKFNQIGQFTSKPNPSEFNGKRIRDKDTGEIFISDGENWIPEG